MNEYWQQQHGLTPDEKQAFVDRVQEEQSSLLHSLRKIHSAAENRMLTRVAIARSGGTGEDDADDASLAKP
jgi:tellurite resistance protein